jgi:hypothetical protein
VWGSLGNQLGTLVLTVTNSGNVSLVPPWKISVQNQDYESVSQVTPLLHPYRPCCPGVAAHIGWASPRSSCYFWSKGHA